MRGTKAQVLDLGLCSIHTKFSLLHFRHFRGEFRLILYTQDGPMYKQHVPMLNAIWPKIGLGPLFYSGIQLLSQHEFAIVFATV